MAGLVALKGKLYGTTAAGGAYAGSNYSGGTVFTVNMTTSKERVLHSFGNGSDGRYPLAGLVEVEGTLYGTTYQGGTPYGGTGTVFSISTTGTEAVLHSFGQGSDGRDPAAALIAVNGTLYGTTQEGGAYTFNGGTVFSISTDGTNENVLHSFGNGNDGSQPLAGLAVVKGRFYGTTYKGGAYGCGTVFRVNTSGNERVMHSFCEDYNDGINPAAAVIEVSHVLYGTTYEGGIRLPSCPHSANICDYGTVFALTL